MESRRLQIFFQRILNALHNVRELFNIKHEQQSILELVATGDEFAFQAVHGVGWFFKCVVGQEYNVTQFIHQKTDHSVGRSNNDVDGKSTFGPLRKFESTAKVDRHHDLTAQVNQAAHNRRRQRDACHLLKAQHFVNLPDVNAKAELIDHESTHP